MTFLQRIALAILGPDPKPAVRPFTNDDLADALGLPRVTVDGVPVRGHVRKRPYQDRREAMNNALRQASGK